MCPNPCATTVTVRAKMPMLVHASSKAILKPRAIVPTLFASGMASAQLKSHVRIHLDSSRTTPHVNVAPPCVPPDKRATQLQIRVVIMNYVQPNSTMGKRQPLASIMTNPDSSKYVALTKSPYRVLTQVLKTRKLYSWIFRWILLKHNLPKSMRILGSRWNLPHRCPVIKKPSP